MDNDLPEPISEDLLRDREYDEEYDHYLDGIEYRRYAQVIEDEQWPFPEDLDK